MRSIHHRFAFAFTVASVVSLSSLALAAPSEPASQSGPRESASNAPAKDKPSAEYDEDALDQFRIGAIGGVGFPRPLAIEGMVKVAKVVAFGVEYSLLPKTSVSGVDVTFYAIEGDVRVFPFENGFFIGLAAGRQHLSGATTLALPAGLGNVSEIVGADTWLINPRIGYLSTWSWGMTIGIDVGLQIPVSATFTNTIPTQLASQTRQATDVAHLFGKSVLPTVDLLRVGLLF